MMTREENIAKLAQLRSEAEALATKINETSIDGKASDIEKLNEELDKKVNEYTSLSRQICFEDLKSSEDPMYAAVKQLNFMTIAAKDEKVEGSKTLKTKTIIDRSKQIDLRKLHKFCGSIGNDENWAHHIQKLNFVLTAQKCVDLGIDPKAVNDSYSMSEIAREFNLGKNPASNTNLLKSLNKIVASMLGEEYKAKSHDVNYLTTIYAKKNRRALTVTCANHSNITNYIAEICHRIVTNGSYGVEFKTKDVK